MATAMMVLWVLLCYGETVSACVVGCDCDTEGLVDCQDRFLVDLELEEGTFDGSKESLNAAHNYIGAVNFTALGLAFPRSQNVIVNENADFDCIFPESFTVFSDCESTPGTSSKPATTALPTWPTTTTPVPTTPAPTTPAPTESTDNQVVPFVQRTPDPALPVERQVSLNNTDDDEPGQKDKDLTAETVIYAVIGDLAVVTVFTVFCFVCRVYCRKARKSVGSGRGP